MANDSKSLDVALAHVNQDRRGFLKTLLVGSAISAVAAIPLMTSQAMAQKAGEDPVNGKCDEGLVVNKAGKCAVKKAKKAE
jgi:hypothetical protein